MSTTGLVQVKTHGHEPLLNWAGLPWAEANRSAHQAKVGWSVPSKE